MCRLSGFGTVSRLPGPRRRLDLELVRRGLSPSRERAQLDIAAGRVLVAGAPADKAARMVSIDEPVVVLGDPPRFVSRGGEKLDAALERFGIAVAGRRCLDAGASTGGFTDCLLQRGATGVTAVDVGHGQLDAKLRHDPRVDVRERTNIRSLDAGTLGVFDVVVADLSFISLGVVVPVLLSLADPGGDLLVLVKPQFEAGHAEASRGKGVVRDPAIWRRVLREVAAAIDDGGAAMIGVMASPLTGANGNREFLAHVRSGARADGTVDALVEAAVDEAISVHGAP
jgi:23S rRNA (cytidine1920-2'-O)/16S rRNA (cytidine1409-2'-O)-methyltransferase